MRQYIAESAPRQLNLAPKDRESCLRAAQHTTHPSALLPAFLVAEANLRGHSHPRFIRWATANGSRARIVFLRVFGAFLVLLGLGLDAFFILSRQSHFFRIICLLLWWPGLAVLIAACKSLCIFLHFHGARQFRPWELFGNADELGDDDDYTPLKAEKNHHGFRGHSRRNVSISSIGSRGADPLRKTSLQVFGPSNDFTQEPWVQLDRQRSIFEKIATETAPVQNTTLRLLQDRTVFLAVLWGGLIASIMTVASLFVPPGNFFL